MFCESYFKHVICEDGLENIYVNGNRVGYRFKIRFPSYRGTQLSCITDLTVKINGAEIDKSKILFCLNSKQFLLSQLPELFNEYWFILDEAELQIEHSNGLEKGEYEVDVGISYKIPYTGYFGNYLNSSGIHSKKLCVKN